MIKKICIVALSGLLFFAGCAPISTLQTAHIDDGTTVTIGTEILNPAINNWMQDSQTTNIDFLKSSCLIFDISSFQREGVIYWPFFANLRMGGGIRFRLLYPQDDFFSEGENFMPAPGSLMDDLLTACFSAYYKFQLQTDKVNIALTGGVLYPCAIIISPYQDGSSKIVPFVSIKTLMGIEFAGSTGMQIALSQKLKLLWEINYSWFRTDSAGSESSSYTPQNNAFYPIFGIALKYVPPYNPNKDEDE